MSQIFKTRAYSPSVAFQESFLVLLLTLTKQECFSGRAQLLKDPHTTDLLFLSGNDMFVVNEAF